jgi:hypothetical protein
VLWETSAEHTPDPQRIDGRNSSTSYEYEQDRAATKSTINGASSPERPRWSVGRHHQTVLQAALEAQMSEHLGYEQAVRPGRVGTTGTRRARDSKKDESIIDRLLQNYLL